MKKFFEPERCIPVGKDWPGLRCGLGWGMAWCAATSLSTLTAYFSARQHLFEYVSQTRQWVLVPGRTMAPFHSLIGEIAVGGYAVFLTAMVLLAVNNYLYHRQGSMSIYLMKRLPDRMELHRRCWTVPVLGLIAAAGLEGVLLAVYYIIYLVCTPAQCLPM